MPEPRLTDIYEEQLPRIHAFFVYKTGSRADAEDLTQATFERAVRSFDRFDPSRASAGTWLMAIAANLLIDHHRRGASRPFDATAPETVAELAPMSDPFDDIGVSGELAAALAQLTDRDREVVALRFGGDLNSKEISELTGLSVSNVQQILSRSLRRLRALLDE